VPRCIIEEESDKNNQRKLSKFNLFTQKGFFVRFGLLSKAGQTLEKTMLTINKNVVFIDGCVLGGLLYLTHQTNLLAVITVGIKNPMSHSARNFRGFFQEFLSINKAQDDIVL
jgi:hypothetical protein